MLLLCLLSLVTVTDLSLFRLQLLLTFCERQPKLCYSVQINFLLILHLHSSRGTICSLWVWVYLLLLAPLEKPPVSDNSQEITSHRQELSLSQYFWLVYLFHLLTVPKVKKKNKTKSTTELHFLLKMDPQSLSCTHVNTFFLFLLPLRIAFHLTLPYSMASQYPT